MVGPREAWGLVGKRHLVEGWGAGTRLLGGPWAEEGQGTWGLGRPGGAEGGREAGVEGQQGAQALVEAWVRSQLGQALRAGWAPSLQPPWLLFPC